MGIDLSQFHQTFLEESFEGLDAMESSLLNLQPGSTDEEEINNIFRAAHSIKGGSATFGFNDVALFTHVLETLLDEMRSGKREVTQASIDLLLQSVDCVRGMLNAEKDKVDLDTDHVQQIQQRLEQMLANEIPDEDPVSPVKQAIEKQDETDRAESESSNGWVIQFHPHEEMLRTGNDPVRMFRELASLGKLKTEASIQELPAAYDEKNGKAPKTWAGLLSDRL